MDGDSDQDFSDLCARLLKRVRRKDSGDEKKPAAAKDEEQCGFSQSKAAPRRKRQKHEQPRSDGDGASSSGVKEKVLRRMQRFQRGSPPRLLRVQKEDPQRDPAPPPTQEPMEEPESDEALALRLQQQLDREAEDQGAGEMGDGALFLCQLCHKDLSAMSPQLRAQHINRCLDESENSASEALPPPPPPPPPRVPECPVCGRGFKSEKSRSAHLKRCSASMGVTPAELLLILQRQAAERAQQPESSGSCMRTHTSGSSIPVKKKSKKRPPRMDEDTMVALALSRSLLEQEKEREREMEDERQMQAQLSSPPAATAPDLHWKPGAGKRRKRRKGSPAAPPPLLLVQDPQSALNRIQERVSSLLLCPRPPTPPTPKLPPSTLPMCTHSAPLWLKSALPGGGPDSVLEFYCPELRAFIQPWVTPEKKPSEATPVKQRSASASETSADPEQCSSLDQNLSERLSSPACLTPAMSTPGSQALQDLVELAEEGMTLTQYRHSDKELPAAELPLSGFVPEPAKMRNLSESSVDVSKLCSDLAGMVNNPQLSDVQLQVDSGDVYFAHSFMLYTRCPLLARMVHDTGFGVQEDGMPAAQRVLLGDVPGEAVQSLLQYLYTAFCPLSPTLLPHILQLATRFNLSELKQLCEEHSEDPQDPSEDVSPSPDPNPGPEQSLPETQFLELLRSMWQHQEHDDVESEEAEGRDRALEEEDEDGRGSGDAEIPEERVDEEELNEIYEFASTQRKMEATAFTTTSTEEEELDGGGGVNEHAGPSEKDEDEQNLDEGQMKEEHEANTTQLSYRHGEGRDVDSDTRVDQNLDSNTSLDRSFNRLFSQSWGEYVEPSQASASQLQQKFTPAPRRVSSVSEVIDLSISPPPGSGDPGEASLPVAGISPAEGEASKPALNMVPPPCPSTLNSIRSVPSPPRALGPAALSRKSSPRPGLAFSIACNPDRSPSVPNKPHPSRAARKEPELIVLSDCSDDSDPSAEKVSPHGDATTSSPSRSPPRLTRFTKIKESMDVPLSSKVPDERERLKNDQPEGGPCGSGSPSLLDGSAEVSWLIPATPEASTRSSSTQTHSSMRRIQLFPVSRSSSSSSVHDNSETSRYANTSPKHTHPSPLPDFMPSSSTPLHSAPCSQPPQPLGSPLLKTCKLKPHSRATLEEEEEAALSLSQHVAQVQIPGIGSMHPSNLQSHPRSYEPGEESKSPAGDTGCSKTESDLTAETGRRGNEQGGTEEEENSVNEVEMVEEASFCAFDEPPIPFDDSWGLGGGDVGGQGPCFSLRLESSGDPGLSEHGEQGDTAAPQTPSPPGHTTRNTMRNHSVPDPAMWDSWEGENDEEEEEEPALPLSKRVGAEAQLKTPVARKKRNPVPLVPITPMPGYSDMETPELKKRLDRYGVRPLPKKQMVLKLKEIHQYTHQLMSSESEEEASPLRRLPLTAPSLQPPLSFKQPTAPPPVSPRKLQSEEEEQNVLPASQDSNTSSTAESERSNPELCDSEDDGSDSEGVTSSQAVVREKDKLLAVRSFILSDPAMYARVLQYQPLALSELKAKLKAVGIRLGTAKLLDFLDSQCITFTTAKPGHPARSRRRARARVPAAVPRGAGGRGKKRTAKPPD